MTNYVVTIYDSAASLATAVELLANTVTYQVIPFMERGRQKFMLIV